MRQAELARRSGLPTYTISRFVRGENVGSAEVIQAIANALGIPPSEIINFDELGELDDLPTGVHLSPVTDGNVWLRVNMVVSPELSALVNLLLSSSGASPQQLAQLAASFAPSGAGNTI